MFDPNNRTVLAGDLISRHHAQLQRQGAWFAISDLDSVNHLFVNGKRCTKEVLRPGDVLRCGEWVGVVVADSDPLGFRQIVPGWYGGAQLAAAVEPAWKLSDDIPIIVQGETGTGKEGVARGIHHLRGIHHPDRSRRSGAFVGFNCAAIPTEMAEGELFGYREGAFSGATQKSLGLFRAADKGTLLLDEVVDLSLPVQAKLLRALELRQVLPLGETRPIAVDVRVVVAVQESLAAAAEEGRFRMDLYARLDGHTIILPPLRERREDVVPLFMQLWHEHSKERRPTVDGKFAEALATYDWPMNVRELVLLVRRLLSMHGADATLQRAHLPERIRACVRSEPGESALPPEAAAKRAWHKTDDEAEFNALVAALRKHKGVVRKAASALEMHPNRAYRLLDAHPEFDLDAVRDKG